MFCTTVNSDSNLKLYTKHRHTQKHIQDNLRGPGKPEYQGQGGKPTRGHNRLFEWRFHVAAEERTHTIICPTPIHNITYMRGLSVYVRYKEIYVYIIICNMREIVPTSARNKTARF